MWNVHQWHSWIRWPWPDKRKLHAFLIFGNFPSSHSVRGKQCKLCILVPKIFSSHTVFLPCFILSHIFRQNPHNTSVALHLHHISSIMRCFSATIPNVVNSITLFFAVVWTVQQHGKLYYHYRNKEIAEPYAWAPWTQPGEWCSKRRVDLQVRVSFPMTGYLMEINSNGMGKLLLIFKTERLLLFIPFCNFNYNLANYVLVQLEWCHELNHKKDN